MGQCLVGCPKKTPEDHAPNNWDTKRLPVRFPAVHFSAVSDHVDHSCSEFRDNHASVRMGHSVQCQPIELVGIQSVHRCCRGKKFHLGNDEEICPTASFCIQWPIARLRQNIS